MQRAQWLRAAILGAKDGWLSTTSLMFGVGAAKENRGSMILSGLAGAVAGACSMAVGQFVSVATQRDIEKATVSHCSSKADWQYDHVMKLDVTGEPAGKKSPSMIPEPKLPSFLSPGRSPAMKVISEDVKKNSINLQQKQIENALPNPQKAAAASGLAFLCGSFVPLLSAMFVAQNTTRIVVVAAVSSVALVSFGGFGAHLGGSPVPVSAARVLIGGWIAMAIT